MTTEGKNGLNRVVDRLLYDTVTGKVTSKSLGCIGPVMPLSTATLGLIGPAAFYALVDSDNKTHYMVQICPENEPELGDTIEARLKRFATICIGPARETKELADGSLEEVSKNVHYRKMADYRVLDDKL